MSFEPKLLLFKGILFSLATHYFIVRYFIFTFTIASWVPQTSLAFLGSILTDQDTIYPSSSPKRLRQIPTAPFTLNDTRSKAIEPPSNPKPKFLQDKNRYKKIYLKSNFLEEPITGDDKSMEKKLDIPLEEPLHTPLKLNSHGQN